MKIDRTLPQDAHGRIRLLMQMACNAVDANRMEDAARYLRIAAHLAKRQGVGGANDA